MFPKDTTNNRKKRCPIKEKSSETRTFIFIESIIGKKTADEVLSSSFQCNSLYHLKNNGYSQMRTNQCTSRSLAGNIIILCIARNAVFYCLLVKANNAKSSCQLLHLFCGRFERSGVQASCRAPT